jgi:hypothetical protein
LWGFLKSVVVKESRAIEQLEGNVGLREGLKKLKKKERERTTEDGVNKYQHVYAVPSDPEDFIFIR